MKKFVQLSLAIILILSACTRAIDVTPTEPVVVPGGDVNTESQSQQESPTDSTGQALDTSTYIEQTSGPLTARIFSSPETTINQQEFLLQGWVNHAAVVSANDAIVIAKAEDVFTVELTLESGANLVDVIVSDKEGNEVTFALTVFVEQ